MENSVDIASIFSLNPATKEGLKNATSIGVLANLATFVWTFFFSQSIRDLETLPALILLVAALVIVRVLIFAADPLETLAWRWPPEPRFFRAHYPSKYLLERCRECADHSPCHDRPLGAHSREYIAVWYEIFDSIPQDSNSLRSRTYEKGFTCRFIFYMKYSFLLFYILGAGTLSSKVFAIFFEHRNLPVSWAFVWSVLLQSPRQLIYIAVNLLLWTAITGLNRPDAKHPTGCWAMWRDINAQHLLRLKRDDDKLITLVCLRNSRDADHKSAFNQIKDRETEPPE